MPLMLTKGTNIHPVPWFRLKSFSQGPYRSSDFLLCISAFPSASVPHFLPSDKSKSTNLVTLFPILKLEILPGQDPIHDLSGLTVSNAMREIDIIGETALPTVDTLGLSGWNCRLELRYRCQHLEASLLGPHLGTFLHPDSAAFHCPSPFPFASASHPWRGQSLLFRAPCSEQTLSMCAACQCSSHACCLPDSRCLFGWVYLVIGTLKALEKYWLSKPFVCTV